MDISESNFCQKGKFKAAPTIGDAELTANPTLVV